MAAEPEGSAEELPFEFTSLVKAVNYQRWVLGAVEPFLGSRVIEIGAGIGNMSRWLPVGDRLILTEADERLIEHIRRSLPESRRDDPRVSIRKLDVLQDDLAPLLRESLDTVVSFNVLEHIEDDAAVLRRLSRLVLDGGAKGPRRVVTFVPAHSWAYGTIDKKHGHFRRYSAKGMRELCRAAAPGAEVSIRHFNLFGLPGWILHNRILKSRDIDPGPVALFDRLIPALAPLDDLAHRALRIPLGQSLLAVMEWE